MNLTSLSLCQPIKKGLISVSPDFVETLAAIDRSAFTRLEGYFRFLTALGANRGVHLAGFRAAGAHSFVFPGLTAGGATFRLVSVTLGLKEFLLCCRKRE